MPVLALCTLVISIGPLARNAVAQNSDYNIDAFAMLPAISSVNVSPDGKRLAYVRATTKEGDYVVEIRDTNDLSAKPVTLGAKRMVISGVSWLNSSKLGVNFSQNVKSGSKSYFVSQFAIVNADGSGDWLVPFNKKKAASFSILSRLPLSKSEVLIQYDVNDNRIPDVVRFNINTGRFKTVLRGNTKIQGGFIADVDGEIRAAQSYSAKDNSLDLYARIKGESQWLLVKKVYATSREDFSFIAFNVDNPNEIYVKANAGHNTIGIYLFDLKSRKLSDRLFGLDAVDADGAMFSSKHNSLGKLTGYHYTKKHPVRYFVDAHEQALYQGISEIFPKKYLSLVSRSQDDSKIIIRTSAGTDPGTYYLLSNKNKIERLGSRFPQLTEDKLSTVKYISYKARDGLKVNAYVTIPKGAKPFPTIVMPHGGPWIRETVIFDEWAQLLAHHGYLVIQPNYRGSTGYGLTHWKAGDEKWGLEMQDDLDDAAQFLVNKGLADPKRLAMFGWSYGGYAAFAGSMRENNLYQCVVAGAGVSDLNSISATINSSRFGRARQAPTLKGISPLEHVDKVNVPILVVHGDVDKRVPVHHSRDFVEKLIKYKKDHKYLELKGADHFYNTLDYQHKVDYYSTLLSWLDKRCGTLN